MVTFNVNASTFFGENIGLYGSSTTLGEFQEMQSVPLSPDNYPIWSEIVDMPANSEITYQYLRYQPDGSYIYEDTDRTLTTGDCGSNQTVQDEITTESGTPPSRLKRRSLNPHSSFVQKRQTPGDMMGLPGRDLIYPEYEIDNEEGILSQNTLYTDLIHYNGLAEYDVHNLVSVESRKIKGFC